MIKNTILKFGFAGFFFFLLPFATSAQKQFHLLVNLPFGIDKNKMEITLENGKTEEKIKTKSTSNNQLILSADYYAPYAAIILHYPPQGSFKGSTNTFFVGQKNAIITFLPTKIPDSLLFNYRLENVLDFKDEKKRMKEYTANEYQQAVEYEMKYEDEIFSGSDTAIQNKYFRVLMKALGMKEVEYAKANPDSYFSFYSFKANVVGRGGILSPDSMLQAFNIFPDKFKYNDEGNYLLNFIIGRASLEKSNTPIDFKTRDITGKQIEISKFKGKKYVMIHFWGTWCSPCIEELPAIKQISDLYKSKDLQIISISVASNYKHYMQAIKKYQMDWIQVYNDLDLYNKFGGTPTPRIYLVDKDWKVIYDKGGLGEGNDAKLTDLKQILEEELN